MSGIAPVGVTLRDLELAIEPDGGGLQWTRTLREGEIGGVVLESNGGLPQRLVPPEEAQALADETARFWSDWLHRSTYTGRWREMVARSAMTLKLMTYAPSGALVAAPTTGPARSRSAASGTGTTGTPGSGTPRSPSTPCSAWATWRKPASSCSGCGTGRPSRPATAPGR